MSFYQSLSTQIVLLEREIAANREKTAGSGTQPWRFNAASAMDNLTLAFYRLLLALTRISMIIRGAPASNFHVFTQAGKGGVYICNYSYCYYKDFHHKTRNKTIATIIAATVILSIIISLVFPGYPGVKAATYNFSQANWSGGLDAGVYPNHTSNQSGWTKYSAKDANIVASASNLTLANAASNFLDTTDSDFAWYDANWSYRRPITLSPATSQVNYQVKVTLTNVTLTGAQLTGGNANGNDIRFTGSDGTTLQDYWIESWSATGTTVTASIWVEVAASGTSQIYIYYGNPSATSASNGTNTFMFFDDFTGTSLDGTKWTYNSGGTLTFSNSIITFTGANPQIISIPTFDTSKYIVEGSVKEPLASNTDLLGWRTGTGSDVRIQWYSFYGGAAYLVYNGAERTVARTATYTNYEIAGIFVASTTTVNFYKNYVNVYSFSPTGGLTFGNQHVEINTQGVTYYMDWVRVRKYASPEPGATVGAEQPGGIIHSNTTVSGTGAGASVSLISSIGTFTSSIKNTGGSNYWGNIVFNTTLNGGTVTMKVRTSNSATMTGAPNWSTCNAITSGTNITGNNCVTSPAQYVQYQATLNVGTSSPTLDDVTIYYGGYAPSATLTSSAFNTQNAGNVLSKLTWTENLPLNTDIKFQVRTAPDSSGAPGTWTAWCGPDDAVSGSCSSATYFTAPTGTETIDDINRDGYANQWFQYKVWLTSADGVSTPTLSGASSEYIINTAPSVGSVTASQGSDGIVSVGYNISDAEQTSLNVSLLADIGVTLNEVLANSTDPGGGAVTVSSASLLPSSGTIQIENEQITYTGKSGNDLTGAVRAANSSKYAGHSLGTAVWTKATTVSGSAGAITGITSTPAAKTATWTIKTDLPGVFRDAVVSPAKIRVSANDSQVGNPVGTGDSANFTLDTKNPAGATPIIVDSTISSPSANLALSVTDDSTLQMRFANAANQTTPDCATDLYNKTTSQVAYISYAATYAFYPLSPNIDGISTVCYEFKDAYNNKLQGSASTPKTPASPQITDISQVPLSKYRDLVWWTAQGGGVTYKVYRDSGAGYALLSTATDPTNYCFDEGDGNCADNNLGALTSTTTYSYKVRAEDADGISSYSSVVSAVPNGSTVGEVDATAPTITPAKLALAIPDGVSTSAITLTSTANLPVSGTIQIDDEKINYTGVSGSNLTGITRGTYNTTGAAHSANALFAVVTESTAYITFSAADNVSAANYLSVIYKASATPPASDSEYTSESAYPSLINNGINSTVSLAGLTANTKYYYKLRARDISGNIASAGPYFFTTTSDTTPPAITFSPAAGVSVASTTAVISWTTSEAAKSQVYYTIDASPGQNCAGAAYGSPTSLTATFNINQSVSLSGLTAGAKYCYKIRSQDAAGNAITDDNSGANYTFTTLPQIPIISSITLVSKTATTANITWTTDIKSTSLIDFGTTLSYGATQGNSEALVTAHDVTLVGLTPGTAYKYRVKSVDAQGNTVTDDNSGAGYTFTADSLASSGAVPGITSVYSGSVTANSAVVYWTTSASSDSVVGYGIIAPPSANAYKFETGSSGMLTFHAVALTGLSPNTVYYYRVKSRTATNQVETNDNSSAGYTFTTLAGTDRIPPIISVITVASATANAATIQWTTDENSSSLVDFGTADGVYTSTQGKPSDSTVSHSVQLISLTPDTRYYFRVRSADAAGNTASATASTPYFNTTTGNAVDCPTSSASRSCPDCAACPASDTAAPKISDIKVTNITFNSATITWTTDEDSTSMVSYDAVSYGIKQNYGFSTGNIDAYAKSHSVALANLDSATTYYFRVSSADARGNAAKSGDQSFKTIAIVDTKDKGEAVATDLKKEFEKIAQTLVKENLATEENIKDIISRIANPPVIGAEGPVVKDIKSYGATVYWQTDRKSNSVVKFKTAFSPRETLGAGDNWQEMSKTDTFGTTHEVALLGLSPATTYTFYAQSQDVLGNIAKSEPKTFTTASASSIFNVAITDLGLNSATVNWETANISTSSLEWGLDSHYGSYLDKGQEKVNNHSILLDKLTSGTTYHYRVRSVEEAGAILTSDDYSFTTYELPQITKYTLGEVKDTSVSLTWLSNIPIDSSVRYTDTDTDEAKVQTKEEKTMEHALTIGDLEAGKSYKMEIRGSDEKGNVAEVPPFEVQTGTDNAPPELSQVRSQSAILGGAEDKVQAIISWRTNELASTKVLWDLGATKGDKFASETKVDPNLTTNHIAVVTQFKPGTVYRFRVVSTDKFGNASVSPDYTILTPVRRQSIVQMIVNQFESIFGWMRGLGR